MPLKSKDEGRLLNARFGHEWVKKHHFGGSQKGLPEKVPAKKGKKKPSSFDRVSQRVGRKKKV